MSARGIPKSYRHMHGFGSHTFSFINAANERFWVKFHFRSQQGVENLTDAESTALIGADRESHQRDLPAHTLVESDPVSGYRIYRLDTPLAPGAAMDLE